MSEPFVFNITMPNYEYFGNTGSPVHLSIYGYKTGVFLSNFSGSMLSVTTGCTLAMAGISGSHSADYKLYTITLNDNNYLMTGQDEVYETTLYNYYMGIILSYYSGSTIGNINGLTIEDFEGYYIV